MCVSWQPRPGAFLTYSVILKIIEEKALGKRFDSQAFEGFLADHVVCMEHTNYVFNAFDAGTQCLLTKPRVLLPANLNMNTTIYRNSSLQGRDATLYQQVRSVA